MYRYRSIDHSFAIDVSIYKNIGRLVWRPARGEDVVSQQPGALHTRSRRLFWQTATGCQEVDGHRRCWRAGASRHPGVCRHCPRRPGCSLVELRSAVLVLLACPAVRLPQTHNYRLSGPIFFHFHFRAGQSMLPRIQTKKWAHQLSHKTIKYSLESL